MKIEFQKKQNKQELRMNRLKVLLFIVTSGFLVSSCDESFQFKFQDRPELVSCEGANGQLVNEALYSFFDDITTYYRKKDTIENEGMSTMEAYANFIYSGSLGEADYKNIVSDHTRKIVKQLKKDQELWTDDSPYSKLNHHSEFVSCLFSKMENEDLKATLLSLREINSVSPKMLAERFRTTTGDALKDPNYGMYIALDTYYQHLLDLDL